MIRLIITLLLVINIIEMISCYSVPEINIRALRPSGIEASIPNVEGIEIFTFIVHINPKLPNNRTLLEDVYVPTNGKWVFRDSSVQLKVGDILFYFINVQYKKKPYAKVKQLVIKESHFIRDDNFAQNPSSPASRPQYQQQPPTEIPEKSHIQQKEHESCERKYETIDTQLNIILSKLKSIHDESSPLQDKLDSMIEVLNHLLQDSKIGTKLLLRGNAPPGNVLESVRELVTDKLKLHDMYSNIISAKKTEDGILFEVKSPLDKKRILYRANQYLQNSKLKIYDNNVMVPDNIMEQDNMDDMDVDNFDARFGRP